jgi:acyl dehydratase
MLRVRQWTFQLPVFAGDTIRCTSRVLEKTLRGRGKRGEVVWYRGISNQDGKIVQWGELVLLIEARPLPPRVSTIAADINVVPNPNGTLE